MNVFRKWLLFSVLIFVVLVQTSNAQNALFAGVAPSMEAGVGYSYLNGGIPSGDRLAMNGVDASFTADFHPSLGIKFDLGYERASDVSNTGHHADILSYMAGPVFYPIRRRTFSAYTQFLLGGARETGVNFDSSGQILTGFVNHVAWAAGGGVQYRLTPFLSIRLGADYMRTSFFNSNLVVQGQNNVRSAISIVYTFGGRREHD